MTRKILLVASLAVGSSGCFGGGSGSPGIAGAWEYTSGILFGDEGVGAITYLELREDGSGTIYSRNGAGALGCSGLVYSDEGGVVGIDIPALDSNRLYRYELEGTSMQLIENDGSTSILERIDAVPDSARCGTVTATGPLSIEDHPTYWSGIAVDGTTLHYTDEAGMTRSFDVATSTTGGAYALNGYVLAKQDASYWTHCACGWNEGVRRVDLAGAELDDVNTEALGVLAHVTGAAWDGTSLWIIGNSHDDWYVTRLLRIDSNAEPDVVLADIRLEGAFRSLSFARGKLFTVGQTIGSVAVQIDPATGAVERTIAFPFGDWWSALGVTDDAMYATTQSGGNGRQLMFGFDG